MKKLAAFVSALALACALFFLWTARLWPFDGHPTPVEVTLDELRVEHDTVRISGTAHYPLRIALTRAPRLGRPATTWHLYPLFERGDTSSTLIVAMVASPTEPEDLVSFEDLTVEGWALPPRAAVTAEAEEALRLSGYTFAEDYVLIEMFELDE